MRFVNFTARVPRRKGVLTEDRVPGGTSHDYPSEGCQIRWAALGQGFGGRSVPGPSHPSDPYFQFEQAPCTTHTGAELPSVPRYGWTRTITPLLRFHRVLLTRRLVPARINSCSGEARRGSVAGRAAGAGHRPASAVTQDASVGVRPLRGGRRKIVKAPTTPRTRPQKDALWAANAIGKLGSIIRNTMRNERTNPSRRRKSAHKMSLIELSVLPLPVGRRRCAGPSAVSGGGTRRGGWGFHTPKLRSRRYNRGGDCRRLGHLFKARICHGTASIV